MEGNNIKEVIKYREGDKAYMKFEYSLCPVQIGFGDTDSINQLVKPVQLSSREPLFSQTFRPLPHPLLLYTTFPFIFIKN